MPFNTSTADERTRHRKYIGTETQWTEPPGSTFIFGNEFAEVTTEIHTKANSVPSDPAIHFDRW